MRPMTTSTPSYWIAVEIRNPLVLDDEQIVPTSAHFTETKRMERRLGPSSISEAKVVRWQ